MNKFFIAGLLIISTSVQAGTLIGAIVGGAVGYAAGKSNSTTTSSPDLALEIKPGILVYIDTLLVTQNDTYLKRFVANSGYKHFRLNKIIVRTVGDYERYYYTIQAWN